MEYFELNTWDIGITVITNGELLDIEGDKKTSGYIYCRALLLFLSLALL